MGNILLLIVHELLALIVLLSQMNIALLKMHIMHIKTIYGMYVKKG